MRFKNTIKTLKTYYGCRCFHGLLIIGDNIENKTEKEQKTSENTTGRNKKALRFNGKKRNISRIMIHENNIEDTWREFKMSILEVSVVQNVIIPNTIRVRTPTTSSI